MFYVGDTCLYACKYVIYVCICGLWLYACMDECIRMYTMYVLMYVYTLANGIISSKRVLFK